VARLWWSITGGDEQGAACWCRQQAGGQLVQDVREFGALRGQGVAEQVGQLRGAAVDEAVGDRAAAWVPEIVLTAVTCRFTVSNHPGMIRRWH
jgi:hypothetical protein